MQVIKRIILQNYKIAKGITLILSRNNEEDVELNQKLLYASKLSIGHISSISVVAKGINRRFTKPSDNFEGKNVN